MFILDTNVVSELRKIRAGKADQNVARWAERVDAGELYISVITVMELELGIGALARRDERQAALLREWFDGQVLPEFFDRILPVSTEIALQCAKLHIPDPRAERDALIAATALVHRMTVVTRNIADFRNMDVGLFNPWEPLAG